MTREHKDACAIIAVVDKRGYGTHVNIAKTIDALQKMGHRSGDINGEGDGCGIATDIPREIWAQRLAARNLSPHVAESSRFFVGHLLLLTSDQKESEQIMRQIRQLLKSWKVDLLVELTGATRDEELGPRARLNTPLFWQVGGVVTGENRDEANQRLFKLQLEIERLIPKIHVASLSLDSVVFKVQGTPDLLPRVYPELNDENMRSLMTLGHGRYSTNTLPTVELSQPFSMLGHNGEINTIERLRNTGRALGINPAPAGSDSQDLNRVMEGLINIYGLDIQEAMEMVFPAIYSEVERSPEQLREVYAFYRWFFPCSAQGPAAVLARSGQTCMGSVDALGLRPLWFGESSDNYFLSSEKGVVNLERNIRDPRPLAPGEKIAIVNNPGKAPRVLNYGEIQENLLRLFANRKRSKKYLSALSTSVPGYAKERQASVETDVSTSGDIEKAETIDHFQKAHLLSAFGWWHYDMMIRQRVARDGREIVGSMGYTGPLAAFVSGTLPNIADYCKENVAVVTNPAIDREREAEHFSTRLVLGSRPDVLGQKARPPLGLELKGPLLMGGEAFEGLLTNDQCREVCQKYTTYLFEEIVDFFTCQQRDLSLVKIVDATFLPKEGLPARLTALVKEVEEAVAQGAVLVVLDDSNSFKDGRVFIDPTIAVAFLQEALIKVGVRREFGLVVRSAAIRNLHDIMMLVGLGADAVYPYLLWRIAGNFAGEERNPAAAIDNTYSVLQKGMEKVMSTMGIHEICGYGRIFSSIGLKPDLANILRIPNFCASESGGLGVAEMEDMARKRLDLALTGGEVKLYKDPAKNPKVGRVLRNAALGKTGYLKMAQDLVSISDELPAGIRHILRVEEKAEAEWLGMEKVDISIGQHAMPLVIAAMSFGSQGENSFRTYAQAAQQANIISMNGEGGEIPDMLGKYRQNRGQQIASGRFGVFMGLLNSADFLEVKIGQGAKPGEGGHLPGTKVSEMVANARHCKEGITLISPSNHHDIYSIEDLAQIITELKTANPFARISIKIPVTSGVGTIAVGIAKAGADIVNISGFEGGTGAAREHAKKFVGLPTEIGVSEAHQALIEAGLRDGIEIWADGGMRSGDDVLKMILLGANRVGLGTVALMGIGCISCQRCHLDTCPRGISTQLQTKEQAAARKIAGFTPRVVDQEAENLTRLLNAIGDELRMRVARLGELRLQDLVGRTDLLQQCKMMDSLDCSDILKRPDTAVTQDDFLKSKVVRKPLNYLTRLIGDLAMERFEQGDTQVHFAEEGVQSIDRAVGTYLAGAVERRFAEAVPPKKAILRLGSSVPGNGLCAFISGNIETVVEGGAQDGAAKGCYGGHLGVFKGKNLFGGYIDGSTGKSFAYGAIGGLLMVQNMADSRACIRMSGADVVFGGRITSRIHDEQGNIASRSHLKGFAFEYMTGGRAVVLGDPGPWMCAGMTGGVVYLCLYPEFGFDRQAVERRLSWGANVNLKKISKDGLAEVELLLGRYMAELEKGFQTDEAAAVSEILQNAPKRFIMISPKPLRPHSSE